MVESPATRYPRMFTMFVVVLLTFSAATLKLGFWFADTAPETEAEMLTAFGWALGAGTILVAYRLARWLDGNEPVVARIERTLGGDA